MIDARALVDSSVLIGDDVTVGPFTVIEAGVSIGPGNWIGPNVVIRKNTTIGAKNKIYQFSSIGEDPQFTGYLDEETFLVIGDRNTIREYCTLNRGSPVGSGMTRIGSDNLIMAYAHIAHDSTLGDHITFANGASLAGHVEIGDYAILGGFTLVHQFCRIGSHSITGIGTVCLKDVLPYTVATGNTAVPRGINTKGLRPRGFSETTIQDLRHAYRFIYRNGLTQAVALEKLGEVANSVPEVAILVEFIRNSRRGIIR